jgi:uncharacterized protein YjbI with pentapeptide repeats
MTREEALAEIEASVLERRPAQLAGTDLYRLNLEGAYLEGANLTGAILTSANLSGAILLGADLSEATLIEADLRSATLTDANLRLAYLAGADLTGATLDRADLEGADLYGADLTRAHLAGARLTRANLEGANLEAATLRDATLSRANLRGANLRGANLKAAYLGSARLYKVDLTRANLEGADLTRANLRHANLTRTDLKAATLRDADLTRAHLTRANLTGANLEGANLTGANLTNAILTNTGGLDALEDADGVMWPAGFSLPTPEVTPYRAYGKQSAAVLKLRKTDTPRAAKEFKKKYPTEFESLKQDTQGRDFSDQIIARIAAKHSTPFDWAITYGRYSSRMQRLCSEPNQVIKLNIDLSDARFTDRQRKILGKIRDISRQSGHPTERHPFFTIGWVRYCELPDIKTLLVEEVQSDVQGVRKGLKDPATRMQLESGGLDVAEIEAATALLLPYTERFYEDALGIIFDIAQKSGSKVEMLHYDTKRQFGSPSAIYTDLPRSMGMKLSPGSEVIQSFEYDAEDGPMRGTIEQTWKITPNRKRRTSRRARRTSRS